MKRFVLSSSAELDLKDIWSYIAHDNEEAASRVVEKIRDAIRTLAAIPRMGRRYPDLPNRQLRVWPVYSYLVIYEPDAKPLKVVRIIHGARDIPAVLERI